MKLNASKPRYCWDTEKNFFQFVLFERFKSSRPPRTKCDFCIIYIHSEAVDSHFPNGKHLRCIWGKTKGFLSTVTKVYTHAEMFPLGTPKFVFLLFLADYTPGDHRGFT